MTFLLTALVLYCLTICQVVVDVKTSLQDDLIRHVGYMRYNLHSQIFGGSTEKQNEDVVWTCEWQIL